MEVGQGQNWVCSAKGEKSKRQTAHFNYLRARIAMYMMAHINFEQYCITHPVVLV
jgi:hypothetical protein